MALTLNSKYGGVCGRIDGYRAYLSCALDTVYIVGKGNLYRASLTFSLDSCYRDVGCGGNKFLA